MESFHNDSQDHHHLHHRVVSAETGPGAHHDGVVGASGGLGGVRALTGCVLLVLIVSTLLGNMLVCAAVIKFRHLRSKVTNFFVISLAVSDLFVAVLVMPWKAVSEVAGCWTFGRFCDTWIAFDIMCSTASILNLCIISMDRYWAISSPFRYERKMTQRFAFVMIGVAWTLSVLISFIPVQLNWHRAEEAEEETETEETNATADAGDTEDCNASLNRTYAISSSLISFYIPVVIMVGTYTRIFRIAQTQIRRISSLERAAGVHHAQNNHNHVESSLKTSFKKETKVLKTLSIIMGVFVFCWLPFFVLNCVVPFCDLHQLGDPRCVSDTTFNIFVWFGWANSSLNPVIYAFNADFRKAFSTILGCNKYCSSSTVEAVDFSNELVSYHHDTTLQKEATLPGGGGGGGGGGGALAQRLPCIAPHNAEDLEERFDKVSGTSDAFTRNQHGGHVLLPTILQFECEAEISLHLMPFNSSGHVDCSYVIPGQIED